ncbi:response regulator [Mucilaginibacter sp. P25]|uniref:histidine kinase n=2 Tax=Mucilaginibacter TaxID=423349 RepID=A0A1G8MIJ6_9SPHI|nr:response regulator [Mucilaginibacter gossypii]SDI67687.1 Signal transduction histidine kinase [Mucilaginibacter gossypii]
MHLAKCSIVLLLLLLGLYGAADAQDTVTLHHKDFGAYNEISLRDKHWFFHPEINNANTPPDARSGGWEAVQYTAFGTDKLPAGWKGIGWFNIWVKAGKDVAGQKFGLRINHDGASEIFIDGEPIGGYGKIGHPVEATEANRAPLEMIPFWLKDNAPHLVTIHYANPFGVYRNFVGFEVLLTNYDLYSKRIMRARTLYNFVPMCAAAAFILGLLHFLLFLFYPKQKLNFYYALFVMLTGITSGGIYLFYLTAHPQLQYIAHYMTYNLKVLLLWWGLILLYKLDYGQVHRWRQVTLACVCSAYLLFYFYKFYILKETDFPDFFSLVFLVCNVDGFICVYHLIRKGRRKAWLVTTGVMAVFLVYIFCWDDTFGVWPYGYNSMRVFVMSAGELVLPVCLSLYLALDYAGTNQQLAAQLAEVEALSASALLKEAERTEQVAAEARKLEAIVQQRTAELEEKADKLRELDAVKSRFFGNIAHEFRTPLTLILNPVKELAGQTTDPSLLRDYRMILNNAERLLRLINQLLDLSKLEQGLMELLYEPLDLNALLLGHVQSFEPLALQKGITLHFRSSYRELWVMADRDKLDKVMLNVIGNAVKFTAIGRVEIFLYHDDGMPGNQYVVRVRDTGKGIPRSKLPYIFSRFYQANSPGSQAAEGSGIGLALCKELIELMGGSIAANSWEGAFTEVVIQLPLDEAAGAHEGVVEFKAMKAAAESEEAKPDKTEADMDLILLVEDHRELRDFIERQLAEQYRVITASDGKAGITMGIEQIPALIITDVMMPDTDGYELCGTLKKDERTSHIPVIMLTAKADVDSRVKGIQTGADAYLAKPFEKRELLALIGNLIGTRNILKQHVAMHKRWLIELPNMPTIEQAFLNKIKAAVENNLDDNSYGTDQMAGDIGMSRIQLHRKLKAITGRAPGELVREIRLQHAHDLLARRTATIAEVAYQVGFSSPASFSASFSRHFGFSPKQVNSLR